MYTQEPSLPSWTLVKLKFCLSVVFRAGMIPWSVLAMNMHTNNMRKILPSILWRSAFCFGSSSAVEGRSSYSSEF